MQGRFDLSERRVCRFRDFERTAVRYQPERPQRDAPLRARLRELAAEYPRWGGRACTGGWDAKART